MKTKPKQKNPKCPYTGKKEATGGPEFLQKLLNNSSISLKRVTRIGSFSTFVLHGKLVRSFCKLLGAVLHVFCLLLRSA